jgi:hypothetical protein
MFRPKLEWSSSRIGGKHVIAKPACSLSEEEEEEEEEEI